MGQVIFGFEKGLHCLLSEAPKYVKYATTVIATTANTISFIIGKDLFSNIQLKLFQLAFVYFLPAAKTILFINRQVVF